MRQIHRTGEKLFIDYVGPTLALSDGSRAYIFVGALGASSDTFAYATAHETTADWLGATAQALRFFGGVPLLIVPVNARALIADSDRYCHAWACKRIRNGPTAPWPASGRAPCTASQGYAFSCYRFDS